MFSFCLRRNFWKFLEICSSRKNIIIFDEFAPIFKQNIAETNTNFCLQSMENFHLFLSPSSHSLIIAERSKDSNSKQMFKAFEHFFKTTFVHRYYFFLSSFFFHIVTETRVVIFSNQNLFFKPIRKYRNIFVRIL